MNLRISPKISGSPGELSLVLPTWVLPDLSFRPGFLHFSLGIDLSLSYGSPKK